MLCVYPLNKKSLSVRLVIHHKIPDIQLVILNQITVRSNMEPQLITAHPQLIIRNRQPTIADRTVDMVSNFYFHFKH